MLESSAETWARMSPENGLYDSHSLEESRFSQLRTRIPPIGFETLEPETSSDDDCDYNYDHDVSDIEHWLASDGHDVDMA